MGEINWRCVEPTACLKGDIMFKPGQKVVYNGMGVSVTMRYPIPFKEELTILKPCNCGCNGFFISGYTQNNQGVDQVFWHGHLIPLDHWQQAETMVEVLKEDLELVEVV